LGGSRGGRLGGGGGGRDRLQVTGGGAGLDRHDRPGHAQPIDDLSDAVHLARQPQYLLALFGVADGAGQLGDAVAAGNVHVVLAQQPAFTEPGRHGLGDALVGGGIDTQARGFAGGRLRRPCQRGVQHAQSHRESQGNTGRHGHGTILLDVSALPSDG
jgi:hypothetical protein